MPTFALTGATVFDGEAMWDDAAVVIADGRVETVCRCQDVPDGVERRHLDGGLVAPGFVDIQVNGGGGVLLNDMPTVEGVRRICEAHRRFGSTALLPTVITDRPEVTYAAIEAVGEAMRLGVPGCAGIHVEGPFIARARKGAHDPALIRPMTEADLERLASSVSHAEFGLFEGAQPVRRIRPRTGRLSMPGWFPTAKGTLPSLRTETLLELDGLGQFEVNPEVVLMATQPHTLTYHRRLGRGATKRAEYVPDVALLMADGEVVIVDFKPARFAAMPAWQAKEDTVREAYERDHDARFVVVKDDAIYIEPRRTNVSVMLAHRAMDGIADVEAEVSMLGRVARLGLPSTIGELSRDGGLTSDEPHVDRAFTALVRLALAGQIRFDLGVPLGPGTPVLPGPLT